jgi:hypothetical protein
LAAGHGYYLSTIVVLQFVFVKQSSSPILTLQDVRGKTTTLAAHLNGMTCWKAPYQLSSNSYAELRGIATMGSSSGHLNQISQYGQISALTYSNTTNILLIN